MQGARSSQRCSISVVRVLSTGHFRVLVLTYVHGLTGAEVAAVLRPLADQRLLDPQPGQAMLGAVRNRDGPEAVVSRVTEEPDVHPRERLLTRGSRSLSDAELLSILIGSGRNGDSALDLGQGSTRPLSGAGELRWPGARGVDRRTGLGAGQDRGLHGFRGARAAYRSSRHGRPRPDARAGLRGTLPGPSTCVSGTRRSWARSTSTAGTG